MIGNSSSRRVRKDHRSRCDPQGILHGFIGDVRQVDQHPQPIHFPYDFFAERSQAAVLGIVGRGVGPSESVRVRQRHVSRTHRMQATQVFDRIFDTVASFDTDQRCDFARFLDANDIVGSPSRLEYVGVAFDHRADQFDLLDRLQ
jgi:hypothetical protein